MREDLADKRRLARTALGEPAKPAANLQRKVVSEDWIHFDGEVADDADAANSDTGDQRSVRVLKGAVGTHTSRIPKNSFVTLTLQHDCAGDLSASYDGVERQTSLVPGHITICPPTVDQEYRLEGWVENTMLLIDSSIFDRVAQLEPHLPTLDSIVPMTNVCRPRLARLVEEQYRIQASKDAGWKVLAEANNLRIALEILMAYSDKAIISGSAANLDERELRNLNDYIDTQLGSSFSLTDLASVLDRSPLQMARAFKATTGETPYRYILMRRIGRARTLLESSSKTIAEIAYECGFASQSHMTTVFSDKLGITPGKYRKTLIS
ncbi:MAG: AraC family transcriptional regulator [Pseudomonadota bacterium]